MHPVGRLVYLALRWLVDTCQSVFLTLTLVRSRNLSRGDVVHVQRVLWRRKSFEAVRNNPTDFITIHERYVPLSYLKGVDITLYSIDANNAYFVQSNLGEKLYSSDVFPFLSLAQFYHAECFLEVPLESFLCFAEDLGDPKAQVILLSNTGRCGSTLLLQMLEATGKVIALSEPEAVIAGMSSRNAAVNEKLSSPPVLIATFRVLCKPGRSEPLAYVIKPRGYCVALMDAIHQAVPFVKHAFLYRNGLDTVTSFANVFVDTPQSIREDGIDLSKQIDRKIRVPSNKLLLKPEARHLVNSQLSWWTWNWASEISYVLRFIASGKSCVTIRYEDLLGEKGYVEFSRVLTSLCLPTEHASKGLLAREKDSQRGTDISRQKARRYDGSLYEGDQKARCDAICDLLKVPRLEHKDVRF